MRANTLGTASIDLKQAPDTLQKAATGGAERGESYSRPIDASRRDRGREWQAGTVPAGRPDLVWAQLFGMPKAVSPGQDGIPF